jgi:predicted secreted protein
MDPVSALLVYFLVWWMVLFCVLPLNITRNTGEFEGSGAPVSPNLRKKFLLTTGISFLIWALVCGVIMSGVFDFRASSMKMIEDNYDKN